MTGAEEGGTRHSKRFLLFPQRDDRPTAQAAVHNLQHLPRLLSAEVVATDEFKLQVEK